LTRLLAALVLLFLAPSGLSEARAQDGGPDGGPPPVAGRAARAYANPSAAIAAELAFARLAQEKGQWTAFKATAAEDAVMFTPSSMVPAQSWLKDRANPSVPLAWQPHEVWASCDGSMMITSGAWQRSDAHGWFTTVWQRQEEGGYRWVFGHRDETREPIAAPDMIAARIADCPERRRPQAAARPAKAKSKPRKPEPVPPVPFDPARREGRSRDGTLTWQVAVEPSGTHAFTAQLRKEGEMEEFRNERVAGG
jgi:hypothetical protein